MRHDRREVSFIVNKNFLESEFYKFLTENFHKFQQIEQNNQSIVWLYNIFQIMVQEIIKIKNALINKLIIYIKYRIKKIQKILMI